MIKRYILLILLLSISIIILSKRYFPESIIKNIIEIIGYLTALYALIEILFKLFINRKLKTKQSVIDNRLAEKYGNDINSLLKRIDKEKLNFEKFLNSDYKFTTAEEIHSKETAFQLMKEELIKFKNSYGENRLLINKAIKQIELIKKTNNYNTKNLLRTLEKIKSKYN